MHERYVRLFVEYPPRPLWLVIDCERSDDMLDQTLEWLAVQTAERSHLTTLVLSSDRGRVLIDGRDRDWADIVRARELFGAWTAKGEVVYGSPRTAPAL